MPIFGKDHTKDIQYLNEERLKLWQKLKIIETEISKNASAHEKDAKQASKKAAEYKNRAQERRDQIESFFGEAAKQLTEIELKVVESKKIRDNIIEIQSEAESSIDSLKNQSEELETKITKIEEVFVEYPNLEVDINTLNTQLESSQENSSKITASLKGVNEKKNEINEIFYEIVGYDEKNEETEELEHIDGLKDKLESQYEGLTHNLKGLRSELDKLIVDKTKLIGNVIIDWNEKYDSLIKKIEGLLPNALTAGLSAAYSAKKEIELENFIKLKTQFNIGIGGLIFISLLTVFISIYFIKTGTPFREVIEILPNISAAIIPLYIPVLWFTFAANKKLNLSKRLIEEYTHKEVISKTFEGLSTQIENLDESEISNELRLKLLYNLLEMSTENPGKLISDYKKIDHPVLDVLNQQSKLDNAMSKMKDIPGINRFNDLLLKRRVDSLKKKGKQIETVIDQVEDLLEE